MRTRIMAAVGAALLAGAGRGVEPEVSRVQAAQRPGTGLVEITYDLADADSPVLNVSVAVSTNDGAAFFVPATGLSGYVGVVPAGAGRTVVWDAGAALPARLYHKARVRVRADDSLPPPPSAPPDMVLIPGGTNSGTDPDFGAYSLTVAAFYMNATEVTKAKWDEVHTWAVTNGYGFGGPGTGSGKAADHPVFNVDWYDCVKWCNARSEKEGRAPCYRVSGAVYRTGSYGEDGSGVVSCDFAVSGYRLPTEEEWEYAARGGLSGKRFPWGDRIDHTRANYWGFWFPGEGVPFYPYDDGYDGSDKKYGTGDRPYSNPVGAFAANGYGLYGMAGNQSEWCWGLYNSSAGVCRGGSWGTYAIFCRIAQRDSWGIDQGGYPSIGFRAVLPLGQP